MAATWCGTARMAVFVRGSFGDLLAKWWDGARWGPFVSLGSPEVPDDLYPAVNVATPLTGPPAACSWGPERLDVFARGPWGDLLHKWWDGKIWNGFESLGTPISREAGRQFIPLIGAVLHLGPIRAPACGATATRRVLLFDALEVASSLGVGACGPPPGRPWAQYPRADTGFPACLDTPPSAW